MQSKDSLFIRKMISLVESIDDKIKKVEPSSKETGSEELEENVTQAAKAGVEFIGSLLKSEKGLFSTLRSEIPSLSRFKTADELAAAIKGGELNTAESFKIIKQSMKVSEIALKMKGLVSESPAFKEIVKKVFPKGGSMPADPKNFKLASETLQKTYGLTAKEAEALLQKGASEMSSVGGTSSKAIEKALKRRKAKTKGGKEIELKPTPPGPKPPKPPTPDQGNKIIEFMRKNFTWANIKKWGIPLGLTAGALWLFMANSNEDVPEDFPPVQPNDSDLTSFPECVQKIVKDGKAKPVTRSDGSIHVSMVTSEYPEGLLFFANGRVGVPGGKKGTYKCKGTKIQTIPESFNLTESVDNDVETMIDLLDFPVTGSDLQSAKNLLQKYASGSDGKEFLSLYQASGLGGGSLKKSLNNIYTINASSVRAKQTMLSLINQIESGKMSTTPTTDGDLSGIEIVWDGNEEPVPTPPVPTPPVPTPPVPPKPKFTECDKFPMQMGCKSSKIKEIQVCLGMPAQFQTGKFGPKTKGYLENYINNKGTKVIDIKDFNASGISEALYDEIKRNCGKSTIVTPTGSTVTPTGSTVTSTGSTIVTAPPTPAPVETPLSNEVVFELSNNLKYQKLLNRYVYKGRDLNAQEEKFIVDYMNKKGYKLGKEKDKKFGEKYVFVKRKK
jgi:hypothetical protein